LGKLTNGTLRSPIKTELIYATVVVHNSIQHRTVLIILTLVSHTNIRAQKFLIGAVTFAKL